MNKVNNNSLVVIDIKLKSLVLIISYLPLCSRHPFEPVDELVANAANLLHLDLFRQGFIFEVIRKNVLSDVFAVPLRITFVCTIGLRTALDVIRKRFAFVFGYVS